MNFSFSAEQSEILQATSFVWPFPHPKTVMLCPLFSHTLSLLSLLYAFALQKKSEHVGWCWYALPKCMCVCGPCPINCELCGHGPYFQLSQKEPRNRNRFSMKNVFAVRCQGVNPCTDCRYSLMTRIWGWNCMVPHVYKCVCVSNFSHQFFPLRTVTFGISNKRKQCQKIHIARVS